MGAVSDENLEKKWRNKNASLFGSHLLFSVRTQETLHYAKNNWSSFFLINLFFLLLSFSHHTWSFKYQTNRKRLETATLTFSTQSCFVFLMQSNKASTAGKHLFLSSAVVFCVQRWSHLFTFIACIPLSFCVSGPRWPCTNIHLLSMRQDLSSTLPPWVDCSLWACAYLL